MQILFRPGHQACIAKQANCDSGDYVDPESDSKDYFPRSSTFRDDSNSVNYCGESKEGCREEAAFDRMTEGVPKRSWGEGEAENLEDDKERKVGQVQRK